MHSLKKHKPTLKAFFYARIFFSTQEYFLSPVFCKTIYPVWKLLWLIWKQPGMPACKH